MANIKSAKKRILVTEKKEERNKAIRSAVKTAVKKVYVAMQRKRVRPRYRLSIIIQME